MEARCVNWAVKYPLKMSLRHPPVSAQLSRHQPTAKEHQGLVRSTPVFSGCNQRLARFYVPSAKAPTKRRIQARVTILMFRSPEVVNFVRLPLFPPALAAAYLAQCSAARSCRARHRVSANSRTTSHGPLPLGGHDAMPYWRLRGLRAR